MGNRSFQHFVTPLPIFHEQWIGKASSKQLIANRKRKRVHVSLFVTVTIFIGSIVFSMLHDNQKTAPETRSRKEITMKCILVEPNQPPVVVDTTFEEIADYLMFPSFTYQESPFTLPISGGDTIMVEVSYIYDDNAIAHGHLPNRTINHQIMPGPFYIAASHESKFIDMPPELIDHYMNQYAIPEFFGSGHWDITSRIEETSSLAIIYIESHWINSN